MLIAHGRRLVALLGLLGAAAGGGAMALAVQRIRPAYAAVAVIAPSRALIVLVSVPADKLRVSPDSLLIGRIVRFADVAYARSQVVGVDGSPADFELSVDYERRQLRVTAFALRASEAIRVAEAAAHTIATRLEATTRRTLTSARERASQAPPGTPAAARRAVVVRLLEAATRLPGAGLSVTGPARLDPKQSSPHRGRDVRGGAALGLLAGIGIALLGLRAQDMRSRRKTSSVSSVQSA